MYPILFLDKIHSIIAGTWSIELDQVQMNWSKSIITFPEHICID